MNCKELESTLNDIAREALTDAGQRAAAESHAAGCDACAALLSDARSLTAGLRALSTETENATTPPRVEANLLAAFRAQKTEPPVAAVAAVEVAAAAASSSTFEKKSPLVNAVDAAATDAETPSTPAVVVPFAAKKWSWSQTFGAAGIAAAAAVAFVLIIPPLFYGPRTNEKAHQPHSRQPSRTNVAPPSEAHHDAPIDVAATDDEQDVPTVKQTPHVVVNPPRVSRGALMTNAKYGGATTTRNNGARAVAATNATNEPAEITTDFIPLAQGGGFAAGEGGHVVRVELPRAALAQFGLPVNAEHSGGRVKADVLLGEDGMARAIRFVR